MKCVSFIGTETALENWKGISMKKKSAAKPKRKVYKTKLEVVNVKMLLAIRKQLQAKADKHTDGNLSAFLRDAGLQYVPRKK